MTQSVGIVIPAFRPDVDTLRSYVQDLQGHISPAALRIELDDPYESVVAGLADCPATINVVDHRRGKGAAITAGFEALDTDVLAFADADGSTPAPSVDGVIDPVRRGDAVVAVGSRRHRNADVRSHQSIVRRGMGDAFAWLARRLLRISLADYQCGVKAIHRDAWSGVREHLSEPGFGWDVEFVALADALDYEIVEVPVTWIDEPESTVSPAHATHELGSAVISARYRAKSLRGNRIPGPIERRTTRAVPLVDRLARERYDE